MQMQEVPSLRHAILALTILTTLNLLNYADRFAPSAIKEVMKADLNMTDSQTGLIFTAFTISNVIFSPVFGTLGDMNVCPRRVLLTGGVLVWSLATCLCSLCNSFGTLLIPRIFVGVGEAAYSTLGVSLLCDFFPHKYHNTVIAIFFCAIPVGAALGYVVAAVVGDLLSWRMAFVILGAPGIISVVFLFVKEPQQGVQDKDVAMDDFAEKGQSEMTLEVRVVPESTSQRLHSFVHSFFMSFKPLLTNHCYVVGVFASIALSFGVGGAQDWMISFLVRQFKITEMSAGIWGGGILVLGGLSGTLGGSFFCDKLASVVRIPHFFVGFLMAALSMICFIFSLLVAYTEFYGIVFLFFAATFGCSAFNGPISVLMNDVLPPHVRSRGSGFKLLLVHLFGDAFSPPIIGAISDKTHHLRFSMLLIPFAYFVASIILLVAWRLVNLPEWFTKHSQMQAVPQSEPGALPSLEKTTKAVEQMPLVTPEAPAAEPAVVDGAIAVPTEEPAVDEEPSRQLASEEGSGAAVL